MLVGLVVFLAGWAYAISQFGFFLGVGLGWFPAMVIAWLAMQVVSWGLIIIFGAAAAGKVVAEKRASSPRSFRPKWPTMTLIVVVALLASTVGGGAYFLQSELDGSCEHMRAKGAELAKLEGEIRVLGITDPVELIIADVYALHDLRIKYGTEFLFYQTMLRSASSGFDRATENTRYCLSKPYYNNPILAFFSANFS
jgi:hypothetical protein